MWLALANDGGQLITGEAGAWVLYGTAVQLQWARSDAKLDPKLKPLKSLPEQSVICVCVRLTERERERYKNEYILRSV